MAKQEYVIKNRQWLADKSHEEGVMAVGVEKRACGGSHSE